MMISYDDGRGRDVDDNGEIIVKVPCVRALSVCMAVSVNLYVCLSVCLSVCVYVCQSMNQ